MRILLLILLWPPIIFASSFFESHGDGWFWYEDPPQETERKLKTQLPLSNDNPTEAMMTFRQKVEDSLNLAILPIRQECCRL
jgi:hypothetical protein